jgi:delta-aminolevulinic acid dehydratase/porphobilinogen synthase
MLMQQHKDQSVKGGATPSIDKFQRLRRTRMNATLRSMVRETDLSATDFIYPLFVVPGSKIRKEVSSMPGVFQLSVDEIVRECAEVKTLGIPAVILFGIPEHKDEVGSEAYSEEGIVQRAIRAIRKEVPELYVITDVCLCEYTSHGHCGIVRNGEIINDESIALLAREALTHAQAGADMVAPSDMFDGRVAAITNSRRFRSCRMRQSTPRDSTVPSGRRLKARRNSATGDRTRWTLRTPTKHFVKSARTSKKAQTSSW